MLKDLFAYKAWANREIVEAIAALPGRHDQMRHSSIRILNHTYVVDRIFAAHLSSVPHSYSATNTEETPSLRKLGKDLEESDIWYNRYVQSAAPESLRDIVHFDFTDGDRGLLSKEQILHHVVNHGAYHRGAIGRLLADAGRRPPADTLTRFLKTRDADAAE